ncbi:hypothetical protein LTR36_004811 [Oleoguttula mirabilis]|uniref:Ribosome biogenesis protein SLX9 n=1 Tax=Oleoguttula mirabilis TaxID=1507867 RepID=A0AAV9JFT8_9PEZI|nr:hypothetical protein LTR36_004811 [Oleoguttula mirabilis]
MAPIRQRTALRTRASRSAQDPRGTYAPPPPTDDPSPADFHTGPSTSILKRTSSAAFGLDDDAGSFKVNKKDKRTIRHNVLLAKVEDGRVGKKVLKRRRPGKKLKADLGGLGDALPDVAPSTAFRGAGSEEGEGEEEDEEGWEGISDAEHSASTSAMALDGLQGLRKAKRRRQQKAGSAADGKMVMKSLRHRPGAMKRKRRMEQGEMERFGRNLAQMVGRQGASVPVTSTSGEAGGHVGGVATAAVGQPQAQTDGGGGASQMERWAALRSFIGGTMEKDRAFGAA